MSGRRVLVTGASGFIGSHLVDALFSRGDIPRAMIRASSKLDNLQGRSVELAYASFDDIGSLRDALVDVELVVHVAGVTAAFDRRGFDAGNVTAVRQLLDAIASRPPGERPRVVYVSSLMAAGPSLRARARAEVHAARPNTDYGESKLAGERVCLSFAKSQGLDISIVRPPLVYGPRDKDVLQILRAAQLGVVAQPGMREVPLSIVHVQDLVAGILAVADAGEVLPARTDEHVLVGDGLDPHQEPEDLLAAVARGLYYIDDGRTHTVASFGHAAARAFGRRAITVPLPRAAVLAVGALNQAFGRARGTIPALTFDKARGSAVEGLSCVSDKARLQLGYMPGQALEPALEATIAWYRARGWL